MKLRKTIIDEFDHFGYVVIEDILTPEQKKHVYELQSTLLFKYERLCNDKIANKEVALKSKLQNDVISEKLINLRRENPGMFSMLYDAMQISISLNNFITDKNFLLIASQFLKTKIENLAYCNNMFRIDAPKDKRNTYGWHQDSSYNFNNLRGENCLVCWIPLHDVDELNGSLRVKPCSHSEGMVEPRIEKIQHQKASKQYLIDQETLKKYEAVQLKMKFGDVCFSNSDLFHASGSNETKNIRYTIIARIHNLMSDDFFPARSERIYSQYAFDYLREISDREVRKVLDYVQKLI